MVQPRQVRPASGLQVATAAARLGTPAARDAPVGCSEPPCLPHTCRPHSIIPSVNSDGGGPKAQRLVALLQGRLSGGAERLARPGGAATRAVEGGRDKLCQQVATSLCLHPSRSRSTPLTVSATLFSAAQPCRANLMRWWRGRST